jgi:hypothetical protein
MLTRHTWDLTAQATWVQRNQRATVERNLQHIERQVSIRKANQRVLLGKGRRTRLETRCHRQFPGMTRMVLLHTLH